MSSEIETRRSVRFADSIGPNSTQTLTRRIQRDATVEELRVRIYPGAELDVHIEPFVKRSGGRFPLVDLVGKDHIDGDDDVMTFHVAEPVQDEDEIGVEVANVDGSNSYDFSVDAHLERQGGVRRVTSWFASIIPGVGR